MKSFINELPRLELVDREEFLLERARGKRVLHLGAVDYFKGSVCSFHEKLNAVANSLIGIGNDLSGIGLAKRRGIDNILYGDVERINMEVIPEIFEVTIAGEIIEHLSNPGCFLEATKPLMDNSTQLLITTPNAYCLHRFIESSLMRLEWSHSDHVCYYSYTTLKCLVERHGYDIEKSYWYSIGRRFEILYKLIPHLATGLILVLKKGEA